MKKTLILLGIFLALAASLFVFLKNHNSKSSSLSAERDFAIKNTNLIQKIFIADRNGAMATLRKSGNDWLINDKYKARPDAMNTLLETLNKMEIQFLPPKPAVPNIVRDLASYGIKVEVYEQNDQNVKTFYVGGVTNDERGTYMIMEGSNNPFVMHVPSFDGGLRTRFFTNEDEWRDRTVFGEAIENINEVSVDYPNMKQKSFKVLSKNNDFEVLPFYENMPRLPVATKKGYAKGYLIGFQKLGAEAFENQYPNKDSLSATIPFAIISLTNKKGELRQAKLYPLPKLTKENKNVLDNNGQAIVERYLAFMNTGEVMLIQQYVFGKILREYSWFFEN